MQRVVTDVFTTGKQLRRAQRRRSPSSIHLPICATAGRQELPSRTVMQSSQTTKPWLCLLRCPTHWLSGNCTRTRIQLCQWQLDAFCVYRRVQLSPSAISRQWSIRWLTWGRVCRRTKWKLLSLSVLASDSAYSDLFVHWLTLRCLRIELTFACLTVHCCISVTFKYMIVLLFCVLSGRMTSLVSRIRSGR